MLRKPSIALVAAMLFCASAQAGPVLVLDQQNVVPGVPPASSVTSVLLGDGHEFAQTFTVGFGGILAQIDLQLARFGSIPLVLDIRETTAGVPNSTVLTSVSIDPNTVVPWLPTPDWTLPLHQHRAGCSRASGPCGRGPGHLAFPAGDAERLLLLAHDWRSVFRRQHLWPQRPGAPLRVALGAFQPAGVP
jgi:hypothetical protein